MDSIHTAISRARRQGKGTLIPVRTYESPINLPGGTSRGTDRALVRYGLPAALPCRLSLSGSRGSVSSGLGMAEDVIPQIRTELRTAFLVSLHRGNRVKLECQNDFHQEITRWTPLTVAQIGSVRFGHTDSFREILVSHPGHASKYDAKMTERQREVPPVKHEMNQEQAQALAGVVIKTGTAIVSTFHTGLRQWMRSRAVSAAVAYHESQNDSRSVNQIITTADKFETYFMYGKRID